MHALLPVSALVLNALIWGISWWPLRQLQNLGMHPVWATGCMFGLATLGLLLIRPHAIRGWGQHRELWWLAGAAGLTNMAFNWAVTSGDVVRVVLLFYLMPAWSIGLAWWLLGEKPTLRHITQLVLSMAGVVLVIAHPWGGTGSDATQLTSSPLSLADVLAIMAGAGFAMTNVLLRRLHAAPDDARALAMFGGGVGTAVLVACAVSYAGWLPLPPALAWDWLGIVGVMAILFLIGNYALQYGAARLAASTTALVMLSEVLFASLSSAWAGQATLTTSTLVGGAFIMLGAWIATRHDAR